MVLAVEARGAGGTGGGGLGGGGQVAIPGEWSLRCNPLFGARGSLARDAVTNRRRPRVVVGMEMW